MRPVGTILVLLLVFLAGCSTLPWQQQSAAHVDYESNRQQLTALLDWELRGRLAIRYENDSVSASIHWRQQGDAYQIRLIPPLGRNSLELSGDRSGVTIREHNQVPVSASDPEALMQQQLGWSVPIDGLVYWIRGIPDSALPVDKAGFGSNGLLTHLAQSGWQMEYQSYQQSDTLHLPEKMKISSDRLSLKLSIRTWKTGP